MNSLSLVDVADGVRLYSVSAIDARFLYREIYTFDGYGTFDLPARPFVLDVGANIGMFLLRIKQRHPDATVLAFEPMPDLADCVRRNVELFALDDVTFHEVGLAEVARRAVPFTYFQMLPSSSTRFPQAQAELKVAMANTFPPRVVERMYRGREVPVDIARLSDYLVENRRIDLMKVDTSGSELEVLRGIDERHWPLIDRAVLDVVDQNDRVATVRDELQAHGFDVEVRPAKMAEGDGLNFVLFAQRPGL